MKLDPNQLVGGTQLDPGPQSTPAGDVYDMQHVGGIPLRLEIAARILAGSMGGSMIGLADSSPQIVNNAVEYALDWADALIAAHNATAGEASDG